MNERATHERSALLRAVHIGLSEGEVALLRQAAGARFELVALRALSPLDHDEIAQPNTACVVSLEWWNTVRMTEGLSRGLAGRRVVLLVAASPDQEPLRRLASEIPRGLLVFTHGRSPSSALRRAMYAVCHLVVADSLRARLRSHDADRSLPTRALEEALQLLPDERSVPTLARALHRSERTLRRHLRAVRADLTPQQVLGWAQLLHAAWYLSTGSSPLAEVTNRVGASDAANLRRKLRAFTGLAPRAFFSHHDDPIDELLRLWRVSAVVPLLPVEK